MRGNQNQIYDYQWKVFRRQYLRAFPLCAVVGCGKPAKHVDHIETIRGAPHRRFDTTNVQGLCHSHHSILTAAYDTVGVGVVPYSCDENGNPNEHEHPWSTTDNLEAIRRVNDERQLSSKDRAMLKRQAVLGRTYR